jgi:type IV pilus assembly protein PilB
MSEKLQAILRRAGTLTPQELDRSVRKASARNVPLWDLLLLERNVPEEALADALCTALNLARVRIDTLDIEPAALKTVSAAIARKYTCLPIRTRGKDLVLAMANPLDHRAIQDVEFGSSRQVQPVVASRSEILRGLETYYPSAEPRDDAAAAPVDVSFRTASDRGDLDLDRRDHLSADESAPAVHLCHQIIVDAIEARASDIHIEPGPHELRVRLRVDGVLRDHLQLPRWMHAALVSRLKILAKLDIAQQRLPQDGRIKVRSAGDTIDLRVSTLPTHFGEKAVLRLLGSAKAPSLSDLGLSAAEVAVIDESLSQPQGLILVTGPTGAGKTTSLYSMLTRRQSPELNLVTIEDPIEYQMAGATQVQVDPKAGLTFASCLRAILRQDPDVILVGEIRDLETAEIAFQAALTGHLVFSTLHTNSSLAAIDRLLDFGLRPLLLTSATNLIMAQRLARRICVHCREAYVPSPDALRRLRLEPHGHVFVHGRGCAMCAHTGYSGRVGIFELLRLTPSIKDLMSRQAKEPELARAAMAGGTRFLLQDAIEKMRAGLTTVEEIVRVIRVDSGDGPDAGRALMPERPQ